MSPRGHCATGDTPYPAARLARLIRRLDTLGIAVKADDEGQRLARALGAAALYIPEAGGPGVLVLGERPTCAEVLEEVLHIGQHRSADWRDVTADIPFLELEAHYRLIACALRWGWPSSDIERLERAFFVWMRRYEGLSPR